MASTTVNMGLVKWDTTGDFYNHAQLAANFQAIDTHDHTAAKGVQIPFGGLGASSVGASELRTDAVQTAKILDGAVSTPKIADSGVTNGKLATGAVTGSKVGVCPATRVYNSANFSVPNNASTAVTFDSEIFDTDGMHSTSSQTSRVTFTSAGVYVVVGYGTFAGAATGNRSLSLRLNGTTIIAAASGNPTASYSQDRVVTAIFSFAAADYVEMMAFQDSSSALNLTAAASNTPGLSAAFICKAS